MCAVPDLLHTPSRRTASANRDRGRIEFPIVCDDCQLVCPWNKFASPSGESDFAVRNGLNDVTLVELFGWSEAEFHDRLAGSAIHRIGYERWLRNLAVGLRNAPKSKEVVDTLKARGDHPSQLVREHVAWGMARHEGQYANRQA